MNRRSFIATSAASVAAGLAASVPAFGQEIQPMKQKQPFQLKYAPHFGMFKNLAGDDLVDQLKFAHDEGFRAWEDNGMMKRSTADQERIGKALADLGMEMGVFVSYASFNGPEFVSDTGKEFQDSLRAKMREALEVAQRVNTKWTTVVPGGINSRLDPHYQFANAVENLKIMAEICEPAGLVMVLEPLNWYKNHPGTFLRSVPQAYAICKAVNSPSCKILDDLYHQQIDVGNLIPNMQMAWSEIAYLQVGDNPGRKEPTTGEINYLRIFDWLATQKFEGIIGMEHGNSQRGAKGERAVIDAYRRVDSF